MTKTGDRTPRDDLVYGGICPVCGEEFIDGYGDLEEDESYEARICVDEIDGEGEGKMLVHLTGDEDEEKTPQQKWEEHNDEFQYEPPQKPADAWPSEAYTELWDRVIRRDTQWVCQECNQPKRSLQKARRHVEKQHSERLIDQAEAKIDDESDEDDEPETDGGRDIDEDQMTLTDNDGGAE